MKKTWGVVAACLCMAMMLCAMPALAQNAQTGAIVGRAQDSTGAVIPGVEVTISSPQMIGGSKTFVTDEQGVYRFELLSPGTYKITFALPGFKTLNYTDITVQPNITMTQNGAMEVSSTSEEVTVTSQAPAIDLEAATVGVNWSQKLIDELPWSRSLTGISQMIPATYATSYDIGNSNFGTSSTIAARSGGRSGGNVVMIDGLVWCQTYSDYGSFEEMAVSTNAKGADQMNSGITINMVVKSGSNQFHGNASADYQNGSMQSQNVDATLLSEGYPLGSNKFTHYTDYFGDIGGPVLKDKLWFYVSARQGYQGSFIPGFFNAVGGAPSVFNTVLRGPSAKLSYQLTSKMKIDAYWGLPDKHQPFRGGNALNPADSSQNQDSWSAQGPVLTWTDIIDAKTTAQVRLSRGGYWWPAYAYSMPDGLGPTIAQCNNGGAPLTTGACAAGLTYARIPTLASYGVPNVGVRITDSTTGATDGGYDSNYTRPIRWQWNADFSRVMSLGGKANEVKVGYMGWWDESYTIDFRYPYQQLYTYKSATTDVCGSVAQGNLGNICNTFFLHPSQVTLYDTPNNNNQGGKYAAAYFNDKITVNRKLTVNVGVRYDWATSFLPAQGNDGNGPFATKFTIPYETGIQNPANYAYAGQPSTFAPFPTYNLWSPRVSFAYDVTGNGRLALKASYGRYVGITSSPNSQPGPGANSTGVDPISTRTCVYNNWDGSIPFNPKPDFGPDGLMGTADDVNLSKACPGSGTNGIHTFDSGLKPSYLDEYAAGVEMGLKRDVSVRVNFQRKFDHGNPTKSINVLTPYSAYTAAVCVTDPGPGGTLNPTPGLPPVCTYSVPSSNPAFSLTDVNYSNTVSGEGVASYTSYDFTFNKAYSHGWSFLSGFNIDLGHPAVTNPLTPDAALYNAQSIIPTWSRAFHMNGVYEIPAIPLFVGHQHFGGLQWSSTFTKQSGDFYARTVQLKNASGSTITQTVNGHFGRYPSVADWDQRITKKFRIKDRDTVEIRWDLYNTMNANTVTGFASTNTLASTYLQPNGTPLQPKSILAPRIMEWGASFKF